MKIQFSVILTLTLGLSLAPSAFATNIIPGASSVFTFSADTPAFAGSKVGTFTFNFSNSAENGFVTEDVYDYQGDYDFYYQIANNSTSTDAIARITLSSFSGYTTGVDYLPNTGSKAGAAGSYDFAPTDATRNSASTVGFDFSTFPNSPPQDSPIEPGETSDWIEIATNATADASGSIAVIDDNVSVTENAIGPVATPEPSTWALLGLTALLGFFFRGRRQAA